MRKLSFFLVVMAFMLVVAAGCGSKNADQTSTNTEQTKEQVVTKEETDTEEPTVDLPTGLDDVSASLKQLQTNVETAPDKVDQLKIAGEDVDDKWDAIEDQIEANYPDDYKNIEDSLYPLIDETEKAQPDAEKMKTLITDTTKKINDFKEKVSSGS
ncbi:hypothetical protein QYG89_11250 [Bacillus sp. B190/17]|uniref:Lipoprotein n=1 Tax=Bacillus lumedeiriae TaxID=3058829 RepID=A0ABW8I9T2_9BACI